MSLSHCFCFDCLSIGLLKFANLIKPHGFVYVVSVPFLLCAISKCKTNLRHIQVESIRTFIEGPLQEMFSFHFIHFPFISSVKIKKLCIEFSCLEPDGHIVCFAKSYVKTGKKKKQQHRVRGGS